VSERERGFWTLLDVKSLPQLPELPNTRRSILSFIFVVSQLHSHNICLYVTEEKGMKMNFYNFAYHSMAICELYVATDDGKAMNRVEWNEIEVKKNERKKYLCFDAYFFVFSLSARSSGSIYEFHSSVRDIY
jgi:hypothetical protein